MERLGSRRIGGLLLAAIAGSTAWRAWQKGLAAEPEWSYWILATEGGQPWEETNLGYLPSFEAMLRPFFLFDRPIGVLLFILIAFACSWISFHWIWKRTTPTIDSMPSRYGVWHLVWFSGPFLVSVRNNQVAVQMMALLSVGLALLLRRQDFRAGMAIAFSVILKPIPLTLGLLLLLRRRLHAAILLGGAVVVLSFGLSLFDLGVERSWEQHLQWPARVLGLEPANPGADSLGDSGYFGGNQSVAAAIIRQEAWLGKEGALAARWLVFFASLFATGWAVLRRSQNQELSWDEIALWLAWTAFAAPFGRYYYAVLLVPAWLWLYYSPREDGFVARFEQRLVATLPVLAWFGPSMGVFASLSSITFFLALHRMIETREAVFETRYATAYVGSGFDRVDWRRPDARSCRKQQALR